MADTSPAAVPRGRAQQVDPSACRRRVPVVALALVGCAIAAYLSLYQWGITASVPDPFFGRGSEVVLSSFVARALPVPDAALGAGAYLLEAMAGAWGGEQRWRTAPWVVLLFGALAAGLALAGLGLTLAQLLIVRTGCTLCLASAAISLVNGWLARDEVLATVRYLQEGRERKRSIWRCLWGRT